LHVDKCNGIGGLASWYVWSGFTENHFRRVLSYFGGVIGLMVKFEKFAAETLRKLEKPGLLLVGANKSGKCNVMTIGWGFVGVLWRKPVFVVAVRPSRFTHEFIEHAGEFTVNVPGEGMDKAVAYCGEVSGRRHDKFKKCKFMLVSGKKVSVPVIEECKIHYECKVVHKLKVKRNLIPTDVKKLFYPKGDYHTLYFGRILAVY
jgi:flavin reductase (DIM6/NTAB) family NADH-FMN oxidoreductase RutF